MDQDPEVFTGADSFCNLVKVNDNNISREMALLYCDMILVPLQISFIESGISCFDIVIFLVQSY